MTIMTDPDRPLSTPRVRPDVPPCEEWCDRRDDADRERQHLTFGSISCMSEDLFIPYDYGAPVKIEPEDREDGDYPPVVPAYIKTYLFKDFGRDATINVSVNDNEALQLRFSEASDLIEALTRLLAAADHPLNGDQPE